MRPNSEVGVMLFWREKCDVSEMLFVRRVADEPYVDAPEFFNGAECDDFLQKIVPVVALYIQC